MNLRELLQNRNVLIGIGVVLIIVIVVGISIAVSKSSSNSKTSTETERSAFAKEEKQTITGNVQLVTSENIGKIIEKVVKGTKDKAHELGK